MATTGDKSRHVEFIRPTSELRGGDAQGCGGFHCSRCARLHLANDYTCMPGDSVAASADGVVEKVGWSKTGFFNVRYVRIKVSSRLVYETHYLTDPRVIADETVKMGQTLGACANLSEMYPTARGMKNHVHQYVVWDGILIDAENHSAIDMVVPE
ncbi:MAG: peptidoglycan DD-metalloendopeptidase family protein [Pseudomonadota bacterium]